MSKPTLSSLLSDSLNAQVMNPVLDKPSASDEPRSPFSPYPSPGHERVALIVGPNASGKSFLAQILGANANEQKVLPISISIRERSGSGHSDMGGMRRAMMFGNEFEQSTGETSVSVVKRGLANVASRAEEGRPVLLILDEPEMGLSDDYASAMGMWLGQEVKAWDNPSILGLVLVTHSKPLVKAFQKGLGETPSFVSMGKPLTLSKWLAERPKRSVEDLMALKETAMAGRKFVRDIINKRSKKREDEKQSETDASSSPKSRGSRP